LRFWEIAEWFWHWRERWRRLGGPGELPPWDVLEDMRGEFAILIEDLLRDALPKELYEDEYPNTALGRKRKALHSARPRSLLHHLYKSYANDFFGTAQGKGDRKDPDTGRTLAETCVWFSNVGGALASCQLKVSQVLQLLWANATMDNTLLPHSQYEDALADALEIEAE
jgi:hypothetical protein